jgi:hypothetical protein
MAKKKVVLTIRQRAIKAGYRSGLEETISLQLTSLKVPVLYETQKIKYEVNEIRSYTPDFILPNGIIIESKGRFVAADRNSKTTYGDWCDKHGFLYADKLIPEEWIKEK